MEFKDWQGIICIEMNDAYVVITTLLNLQFLPRFHGICCCQRLHDKGDSHIGHEGQKTEHRKAQEPASFDKDSRKGESTSAND